MTVHRLIYRLDFPTNFDIVNHPGDVARILAEDFKDLFEEIGEAAGWKQHVAKSKRSDSKVGYEITADPRSIVLSMESLDGQDLNSLADWSPFSQLTKVMGAICERFRLKHFSRAGFRVWVLGQSGVGFAAIVEKSRSLTSRPIVAAVEEAMGPISDIGFSFEGESKGKVSYHLRLGPFKGKVEANKYFTKIAADFPEKTKFDVILDIDQFEKDFTYGDATATRWWRPLAQNADRLALLACKAFT